MTGLVRKATLLTFCALLVAGAAMAGVPSAATSTVPGGMLLGPYGSVASPQARIQSGSVPDVRIEFSVTVRDLASNTVPNAIVDVDFSACRWLRIGTSQPYNTTSVNCTGHIVSVTTNPVGVATFRIVGGSENPALLTPENDPTIGCAVVKVGTTVLGRMLVGTPDLDNASTLGKGITGSDLTQEIDIVGYCIASGRYIERADLNLSRVTDGVDITEQINVVGYFVALVNGNDGLSCSDFPQTCCSLLP